MRRILLIPIVIIVGFLYHLIDDICTKKEKRSEMKTMNQKQLRSVTNGMPDVNEQSEKIESALFIGFVMILLCLVLYAAIGAFGCWLYQYNHSVFIYLLGGTIGSLIVLVLTLFIRRLSRLSTKEMTRRIKLPAHLVSVDKETQKDLGIGV